MGYIRLAGGWLLGITVGFMYYWTKLVWLHKSWLRTNSYTDSEFVSFQIEELINGDEKCKIIAFMGTWKNGFGTAGEWEHKHQNLVFQHKLLSKHNFSIMITKSEFRNLNGRHQIPLPAIIAFEIKFSNVKQNPNFKSEMVIPRLQFSAIINLEFSFCNINTNLNSNKNIGTKFRF